MTVQELVHHLKAKRGITAEVVIERSPDGRAYGRFVEDGVPWPKETTFAIRPNGNVFDLAFFKTYKNAVVKTCDAVIYVNLPPPERRAMGYGPASSVPADNGGHAGYAAVIDALNAKLAGGAAAVEPRTAQEQIAVSAPRYTSHAIASATRVRSQAAVSALRGYFETENGQLRALQACRDFLGAKDWPLGDRLRLYEYSRRAFDRAVPVGEALDLFRRIYNELVLPPRAGGWGVARKASGPLWTPEKAFETINKEFAAFAWGGPVTLISVQCSDAKASLLRSLNTLEELKPVAGYPVMAVSKFLHPYNPELFPIYDNEVIRDEVVRRFRHDFRAFCLGANLSHRVGNTAAFYVSYIFWGAFFLELANPRFMEIFASWLEKQPAANLAQRSLDASRLYATAFELTIIGAYADSLRG